MRAVWILLGILVAILAAVMVFAPDLFESDPVDREPNPSQVVTQPVTTQDQNRQVDTGGYFSPDVMPFSDRLLRQLKVPAGFSVNVFAHGLGMPSMMTVTPDGAVYVTRPNRNDVVVLLDTDQNGTADVMKPVIRDIPWVYGIDHYQNKIYWATTDAIYSAVRHKPDQLGKAVKVIADLPMGGINPDRNIAFGPDGLMYVSVNSKWNADVDKDPIYATVVQCRPDGTNRRIYATGLGKTVGMDWNPSTGQLWGVEQGSDWTGKDFPEEELNRIDPGVNYGWPWCYGKQVVDPMNPTFPVVGKKNISDKAAYCKTTRGAVIAYQAHSGPIDFLFYGGGQFPAEYRGDAFVALHGSIFRKEPVGYKVSRVRFKGGQAVEMVDFMTGFLVEDGKRQIAGPSGLAVAKDGALLVTDDKNGIIYRISYKK